MHRLCRVVLRSQIHSAHVGETVGGVDALHVQLNVQVLVKELWIEADGTCQTVHVGSLDDTVLIGVAYRYAVGHIGQGS